MNLKKIALLSSFTLCLSATTMGVEIHDNGDQTLAVKGYFGVNYYRDKNDDEIADNASRIGMHFNHKIDAQLSALAVYELGIDLVNNKDGLKYVNGDGLKETPNENDPVWTRLGYIGAKHQQWGSITIGKQWSPYYLATIGTDVFEIYGGEASGTFNLNTDGGFSGTGRAKQALKYQGEFGPLTVALQYQASKGEISLEGFGDDVDKVKAKFDRGYAVGASYVVNNFTVALGYNETDISLNLNDTKALLTKDKSFAASIAYGELDTLGLHVAATYNQSQDHEVDDKNHYIDAIGTELYIGYGLDEKINLYGGLNRLKPKNVAADNHYKIDYYVIGAKYIFTDVFRVFTEYKINNSTGYSGDKKDNRLGLGGIYYF